MYLQDVVIKFSVQLTKEVSMQLAVLVFNLNLVIGTLE